MALPGFCVPSGQEENGGGEMSGEGGVKCNCRWEMLFMDLGADQSSKEKRNCSHNSIIPSSHPILSNNQCRGLLLNHISDFILTQIKHIYIKSPCKYPKDAKDFRKSMLDCSPNKESFSTEANYPLIHLLGKFILPFYVLLITRGVTGGLTSISPLPAV